MSKHLGRRNFLKMAAATAAGSMLVACQPSAPAATTTPGGQGSSDQPTPGANVPAKGKTELRVVSGQDANEIEVRNKIGTMFQETRPDVTIQMDVVSGDRSESQLKMVAGGNPPDVLYLNDWFQYAFTKKGLLLDLTNYITQESYDFSPFVKEAVEANRYDGKMYAMPFEVSDTAICYNKKLFDEAKVPYPTADINDKNWNWDTLVETAKQLTDESKNQYGFAMDAWMIPNLMLSYDQRYLSNNKQVTADTKATINTENAAKVIKYWLDLREVHKVSPSAAMAEQVSGLDRFMSGKVAMYPYGRWLNTFRTIKDFEWDVTPMPAPKDGHPASVLYILNYGIYAKSQKSDLAWEFLKFLLTEKPQITNVQTGMAVAALDSVNRSPDFLNNAPPEHNVVYADVMQYAKLWDNNEAAYMTYADQVLGQLYTGARTDIEGVLKEASDGIDKALDEWRADNM